MTFFSFPLPSGQIHLIASLTAGLTRYHDEFADDINRSF
jgi:hypothetical protein